MMCLEETAWGKMSVMTVGSFQVFIKNATLTCVLHVTVKVFSDTSIFMFSVQTIDLGMGHLLSWVPNGIFEGVRTQKKKESGSLQ